MVVIIFTKAASLTPLRTSPVIAQIITDPPMRPAMLLSLNTGIKYPRVLNKRVIKATLHITALSQYPQAELSPTKCPKHSLA